MSEMKKQESPRVSKRRGEIFAAAAGVFAEKGYALATVDEIAVAAGISKGSIYNYFESKQDLFWQLFHSSISQDSAQIEALARMCLYPLAVTTRIGLRGDHATLVAQCIKPGQFAVDGIFAVVVFTVYAQHGFLHNRIPGIGCINDIGHVFRDIDQASACPLTEIPQGQRILHECIDVANQHFLTH